MIYATNQQQDISRRALEKERAERAREREHEERRARAKRLTAVVLISAATTMGGGLLALWGVLR